MRAFHYFVISRLVSFPALPPKTKCHGKLQIVWTYRHFRVSTHPPFYSQNGALKVITYIHPFKIPMILQKSVQFVVIHMTASIDAQRSENLEANTSYVIGRLDIIPYIA